MLDFYGNDLKLYPDGLSMAADWEREFKAAWQAQPKEVREDAARRHGLQQERPNVNIPQHLLDNHSGLAVFIHPVEGKEIAVEADAFVGALKKRGSDLSDDEKQTVLGWILSDSISPEFINRMLKEYGGEESVKESFLLRDVQCEYWLDFLFRCYKGHYYRMRYPTLSVV